MSRVMENLNVLLIAIFCMEMAPTEFPIIVLSINSGSSMMVSSHVVLDVMEHFASHVLTKQKINFPLNLNCDFYFY